MKTKQNASIIVKSGLLLGICALAVAAYAQCSFGPVRVTCHEASSTSSPTCCPDTLNFCAGNIYLVSFTKIDTSTQGRVVTCGAGDSAPTTDGGFQGLCAWTETHTDCTGTWSEQKDGPVTLYSCIGSCP